MVSWGGGTVVLHVQTCITMVLVWLMVTLLSCVYTCSPSSGCCSAVQSGTLLLTVMQKCSHPRISIDVGCQ